MLVKTSATQEQMCSQRRCGGLRALNTIDCLGVTLLGVAVVTQQPPGFSASYYQFPLHATPLPTSVTRTGSKFETQ